MGRRNWAGGRGVMTHGGDLRLCLSDVDAVVEGWSGVAVERRAAAFAGKVHVNGEKPAGAVHRLPFSD